jgi:peptidoglycan/xylan/chitin deacetylase (PgdA/CDA1 family)
MDDLLVLCYHGVSESWPDVTAVRPAALEEQLAALKREGYRGATIGEALSSPVEGKLMVVTFDDALRSVQDLAAPILERLGIPGTVYVPTEYVAEERLAAWSGFDRWVGTEHEDELRCMDWDGLRALAGSGWEIGAHTVSHPRLSQIDDAAIAEELSRSKSACEEAMGRPCTSLAYPYSDYDGRAVGAAAEAGYRSAVSVPTRPTSPLPLEWPRVGVFRGESARRLRLRIRSRRLGPSVAARATLALRRIAR